MHFVRLIGGVTQVEAGKILCVGRNYADHAREMNSPVPESPIIFLKPASSIISNGEDILMPRFSNQMHHEVELVVAIGKRGKNIPAASAREHILGYGVGLDMTLRDVQAKAKKEGLPWSIAKGFDTSAPISEFVAAEKIPEPNALQIRCRVNDVQRQEGCVNQMIFPIEEIIQYISSVFTLEAGDLIFTGTPDGVGEVKPGDRIEAQLVGYTSTAHNVRSA